MVEYCFRLTGAPPQESVKLVDIDVNQTVAEIANKVCEAYKLQDILWIKLTHKGRVLLDKERFASLKIDPKKDVITINTSIIDREALKGPILPLAAVEQLILKMGIEDVDEHAIETLRNILEDVGSRIVVMDEIGDPIYWRMVQEHIDIFKRSSARELILPLDAISRLIIRSLRFLGPLPLGKVGKHDSNEALEVGVGKILDEIGLEIANLAKNQMTNSHRTQIKEEDIKSAYVQWQNKMKKLSL